MSATVEVSRTTLEAMAEILRHILATQPAVSPHPPAATAPQASKAAPVHSLRDVMAACAMQGMWAAGRGDRGGFGDCYDIAKNAYYQADWMLWQATNPPSTPRVEGSAS